MKIQRVALLRTKRVQNYTFMVKERPKMTRLRLVDFVSCARGVAVSHNITFYLLGDRFIIYRRKNIQK